MIEIISKIKVEYKGATFELKNPYIVENLASLSKFQGKKDLGYIDIINFLNDMLISFKGVKIDGVEPAKDAKIFNLFGVNDLLEINKLYFENAAKISNQNEEIKKN